MNNTKQEILSVALNLFSQKGYSSVSIRDICGQVGIKESTIYYHFKNKQDIFDTLQNHFLEIANKYTSLLTEKLSGGQQQLDNSFFERVGSIYIEEFMLNDFCNAFIRILFIERFNNEKAKELFDYWMIDSPLTFQSTMFAFLIKIGIIPPVDSEYLAVQYYAPVFLYYEKYMLSGEITEEKKSLFRQHTYKHFTEFIKSN